MEFDRIYNIILSELDRVETANRRNPLLLVGGYREAYVMPVDTLDALFDEFVEGDPDYESMDIDPDADDDTKFEQFVDAVKSGTTYGDYQQFALLSDRLDTLRQDIEHARDNDESPATIYESDNYYQDLAVWINGRKVNLLDSICRAIPEMGEFDELLDELSNL